MPIAALLLSVTASSPEITRTVNVRTDMPLTDLAVAVEAALGFSGRAPHLLMTSTGDSQQIWEDETTGTVADLFGEDRTVAVFLYHPPRNWHVSIELLGYSGVDMPAPLLIEVAGPDVVEACNGPDEMTWLRDAARDFLAGLDRSPGNSAELNDRFPHLSPNQMLRRLTAVDDVVVAERLAQRMRSRNEAPLSFDDTEDAPLPPWPEHVPEPVQNSVLRQAIEKFFDGLEPDAVAPGMVARDGDIGEKLPELDESSAGTATERIRWVLDLVGEGRPLTPSGYLKPADVTAIAEHIGLDERWRGKANRENSTLPVLILRQAMEHFELLEKRGGRIHVTEAGQRLKNRPLELARHVAAYLPLISDADDLAPAITQLRAWANETDSDPEPDLLMATTHVENHQLFLAMGALDHSTDFWDVFAPTRLTEGGKALVGEILRRF